MNNLIIERVTTTKIYDEVLNLTGHELGDVNSAGSSLITPITL